MSREKAVTVYKLSELDGQAKERVLQKLAEWATNDDFWHESVTDDAKTVGKLMGIEIKDIFFSGFSSQGDGACFTGTYSYVKDSVKAVTDYAPQDDELARIAKALYQIERRNLYRLTASITHTGRYSHEQSVTIDTDDALVSGDEGNSGALADTLRDYMHWIYRSLEKEYEYRTSEAVLLEDAEANEWEFDSEGRLA